jgi:hypothetical protein
MKNCLKIGLFQYSFSMTAAPFGTKLTREQFNMDIIVTKFGYIFLGSGNLDSGKIVANDLSTWVFSMVFKFVF